MATSSAVLSTTQHFVSQVYRYTEYEDEEDAKEVFRQLMLTLLQVHASQEGIKLIQKYTMLAKTIIAEGPFLDMVKIIWRMVKGMGGTPMNKLCLFLLGVGTLIESMKTSPHCKNNSAWILKVEQWLGKQLTIGGKGCTGDGEGSVMDRIQRFFSTPYLHDFD